MTVTAIVLAAGRGLRLEARISKPLIKIGSFPILLYSLKALSSHPQISEIIIAVNRGNRKEIARLIKHYKIAKVGAIVLGGKERQDSVWRALEAINRNSDFVLIHDAARPFIREEFISGVIREAKKNCAAILGVPVKATIKRVDSRQPTSYGKGIVKETLDRSRLWEIQTPQVFKKALIRQAYDKFGKNKVSDDASLVEKLGAKVSIVMGSYLNLKITTPEDLLIARAIIQTKDYRPQTTD